MREIIGSNDTPGKFLVGLFTILFVLILWPYVMPLFWALILAVMLRPIWDRMESGMPGRPGLKALLLVLGIALILIVPMVLIVLALPGQINALADVLPKYRDMFTDLLHQGLAYLPQSVSTELQSSLTEASRSSIGTIGRSAVGVITSAASSTVSLFFQTALMLYVLYFFFKSGPEIYKKVASFMPFSDALMERLSTRFILITRATVGGVFVIAAAQGLVAGIIYWILGVEAAIALGVATMVASLIPAVGSGLIWIPVAIFMAVNGQYANAILMLLSGFFVISMVDNFLRPRLVGSQTQIPDFVVLLTTLGGLSLLGTAGIVLGPMIAGLCISLWQMTKPQPEAVVEAEAALVEAPAAEPPKKRASKKT